MKHLVAITLAFLVCASGVAHADKGSAWEHPGPVMWSGSSIGDTAPVYNYVQSFMLTFTNRQGTVGTLDLNGPEMTFQGNADKSARVLFDYLANQFESRLAAERKKARDDVEFCVREHLKSGESPLLYFDK